MITIIIIIIIIIIISCDVVSKQTNKDSFYVTICSLFWGPDTDKVYTLQFRENSFLSSVYLHIEMHLSPKHAWLLPVFPSVGTTCTSQMYRTIITNLAWRKSEKLAWIYCNNWQQRFILPIIATWCLHGCHLMFFFLCVHKSWIFQQISTIMSALQNPPHVLSYYWSMIISASYAVLASGQIKNNETRMIRGRYSTPNHIISISFIQLLWPKILVEKTVKV